MSCQQVSKFITTATTKPPPTIPTSIITTPTAAAAVVVNKRIATVGETVRTTSTPEDPYVFTETTAATTPPILFNAQKSRTRLNEAQLCKSNYTTTNNNNNSSNNNNSINNNSKATGATVAIAAATTGQTKPNIVAIQKIALAATAPLAQLNGISNNVVTSATAATATAVTATTAKTLASLAATTKAPPVATVATTPIAAAAAAAATTTNFNNVTQSQTSPLLLPSQSSQAPSAKRGTNVCVVRPQQQHQQQQLKFKQQQQLQEKQQPPMVAPSSVYTHTPSLWQTPLILDTGVVYKPALLSPAAVTPVSPPTSPASLPSPTAANPPSAAITAMVAPIVVPAAIGAASAGGQPLPPSKFHHTTFGQHLHKVECLKKKKPLPFNNNNNNNNNVIVEATMDKMVAPAALSYNPTQPPPLTVFNSMAVVPQKHSAAVADTSDLSDIPVNVIFRKPTSVLQVLEPPQPPSATNTPQKSKRVKIVSSSAAPVPALMPPTPPTPPTPSSMPPLLANLMSQPPPPSVATAAATAAVEPLIAVNAPALIVKSVSPLPVTVSSSPSITSTPQKPPTNTNKQERMSSKVANVVVASPKRKTAAPVVSRGRKGNRNISARKTVALPKLPPAIATPGMPSQQQQQSQYRSRMMPLSDFDDVPFTVQSEWLFQSTDDHSRTTSSSSRREERIAVRKGLLRRQALQLLSTRSLQDGSMRSAQQRLSCVQSLLHRYKLEDSAAEQPSNRCLVPTCEEFALTMAAHCERHIVNNTSQQIFVPCAAQRTDGLLCQAPVFDVLHKVALCPAHSHLRQPIPPVQQQQQPQPLQELQQQPLVQPVQVQLQPVLKATAGGKRSTNPPATRKRKTNVGANPVGRPQKRTKKQLQQQHQQQLQLQLQQQQSLPPLPVPPPSIAPLPPMMTCPLLKRKSSTTSLESIASNSHSSSVGQLPYNLQMINNCNNNNNNNNQLMATQPALIPIGGGDQFGLKLDADQLDAAQALLLEHPSFKVNDEISQIVAQLAAATGGDVNHNNNNISTRFNNNNNHNNNVIGGNTTTTTTTNSFPSFNTVFGNGNGHGHGHNAIIAPTTQTLLGQDMFGICENSSPYASSEDTGLGGISESELMGPNDADDIALNGAHLLEEHDLVNVFETLPDDAFNELFKSVQDADCEAMDRALEIADKNLKCLQQTIGGSDSAFLNDFLDVGDDDLLAINSPNTSGIDASTLFVDSSSGGGNSNSNSSAQHGPIAVAAAAAATVADVRGLVQT